MLVHSPGLKKVIFFIGGKLIFKRGKTLYIHIYIDIDILFKFIVGINTGMTIYRKSLSINKCNYENKKLCICISLSYLTKIFGKLIVEFLRS